MIDRLSPPVNPAQGNPAQRFGARSFSDPMAPLTQVMQQATTLGKKVTESTRLIQVDDVMLKFTKKGGAVLKQGDKLTGVADLA